VIFKEVSRRQWLVLLVAWLGWVFDSMDATIYALVLHPALGELLHASYPGQPIDHDLIGWYGGLIFSLFLVGWTIGGIVFGVLADRYGRTRILIATIVIYAVFTGLAALSQTWWHLAIMRFITALGIGGEWAAGAALVAESWPEHRRAQAAGVLQSAWGVGFFLAAGFNLLLRDHGWRTLFLVGVLPAMVALIVRWLVEEPERWIHARRQMSEARAWRALPKIFEPPLRRGTIVGSLLAAVAVFGLWGATNWTPTLIRTIPDFQGASSAALTSYVSYAIMALNAGAIVGYLAFGPLAERFGRRAIFAMMCTGSLLIVPYTFLPARSYQELLFLMPILGFFTSGIFSGFPIYLPELYPTALRATGAGFCFNAGRLLAATGPLLTGALVQAVGSYGLAASIVGMVYAVGLVVLLFAPETRDQPLPD
jgi:MFS family permease